MTRAVSLLLVALITFTTFVVAEADVTHIPVAEDRVEFNQPSYALGETAVIFIKDTDLGTTGACTATWTDIDNDVENDEWWNLATGSPNPDSYAIENPCDFDAANPSNTPLSLRDPWTASIDGTPALLSNIDKIDNQFTLVLAVYSSSTVSTVFKFDVVDSYTSSTTRAKITSDSDANGEWIGISEITSETDALPDPSSSLFRGEIVLSDKPTSQDVGDGSVWVQSGDSVTVTYFGADGTTLIASSTANIESPLTPTPIPSSGPIAMIGLTGAFITLLLWRLKRSSAKVRDST